MAADIETRDTGGGTQPLEQLLSEKFGIKMARLDIERALDALPTIHKASVALPAAEAAMYDAADFGEDQDAYRRKMLDNVAAYTRLLSTARTSAEVSALLEVDPSRIRQRVADRTLWALKDQGKWLFPALQFEPDGPRPGLVRGLDKILSALPAGLHPLAVEAPDHSARPTPRRRGQARIHPALATFGRGHRDRLWRRGAAEMGERLTDVHPPSPPASVAR